MYEEREMMISDGISLKYVDEGEPGGIPLILIHGIGDSWHSFTLLFPHLNGFRIVAPTLRGHGDSDKPDLGYDSNIMADDMITIMDGLKIDKAVVLGASSGGLAARDLAIRYKDRVSALILLGSPLVLSGNIKLRQLYDNVISKFGSEADKDFVESLVSGLSGASIPPWFIKLMTDETMKMPARVWKEYTASLLAEGLPAEINGISVPCLIIWGAEDEITTLSEQKEHTRLIRGSHLVIHEGLGHMLYWEDPKAVAEEISKFILK